MNTATEPKGPGNQIDAAISGQKDMPPRLDARRLFGAAREVIIEHEGADYRLRLTANGKLILTK
ncbi:MAG: hemin uptake protein HemP [Ferrovibrio sp.]|nr:hemin uptake protein HemP [Ferrovibrio sp.]